MLGFGDVYILAAFLGSIAVTVIAVIYGTVKWNAGSGGNAQ